jgi:uncharacterized protein (DUF2384 family)
MSAVIMESLFQNRLGFFSETGDVKIDEVQKFLEISRKELAHIFGVSADALREERISQKTKERLSELAGAIEYVADVFEGDLKKTQFWIKTPNPNFGGSSPRQLIVAGRSQYVLKFILAARKGY